MDRFAVIEVGGAGEMDLSGSSSNFGATLAIEKTPIEHWLELEFGVTVLATSCKTEFETDLLFKKPYRLSSTAEFMIGAGSELVRKFDVEGMVLPWVRRRFSTSCFGLPTISVGIWSQVMTIYSTREQSDLWAEVQGFSSAGRRKKESIQSLSCQWG